MAGLVEDARWALRRIAREPSFLAFSTLIIALGVAATTAVFSIMGPLMLRPLPFAEADELVWIANAAEGGMSEVTSRASNLRDYQELAQSFESLAGYNAFFEYSGYNLVGTGEPERLGGVGVTQNFLNVLGVQPLLGRDFTDEEAVWGGSPAVLLTHGFWRRRFAGDPTIIGHTISLNNKPTEVVGVLPPSFDFASTFAPGTKVDFLRPFPIAAETDQWGNTLAMVGRLRRGATVETAQSELDQINARLQEADPGRWGLGAVVSPLRDHIAGEFRTAMLVLAAAAALVLAIASANLSSLLLARGRRRSSEMAVRSAFGATRKRLLRQLVLESVALAATGGVVGVCLAYGIARMVATTDAIDVPLLSSVPIDGTVALFALVVTVVTGVVVGILPALHLAEGQESITLRASSSRAATEGQRGRAVLETLVTAEIAIACVLLVGGGLLLKSFMGVLSVDLGFRPEGAVLWELSSSKSFEDPGSRSAFYSELAARVEAVPGVEAVGLTDTPPLGRNRSWTLGAEGALYDEGKMPSAFPRLIDHRYLRVMGIPLRAGRSFTADDDQNSPRVMVLNEFAARMLFPGQDPIGRNVLLGGNAWEVVGVVGNVRHQSLEEESGLEVYLPISQMPDFSSLAMVVRSRLPVETLAPSVGTVLSESDPAMPTGDYRALRTLVDRVLSPRRFILSVLGAFAATALLLASLGIYAVLSYAVSQRTREIGIRMALGQSASDMRLRVVTQSLRLALIGLLIGSVVSFALGRLIQSLLFGVQTTDLATYAGTAFLLVLVAGIAGYLPARRASKVDPMVALRTN